MTWGRCLNPWKQKGCWSTCCRSSGSNIVRLRHLLMWRHYSACSKVNDQDSEANIGIAVNYCALEQSILEWKVSLPEKRAQGIDRQLLGKSSVLESHPTGAGLPIVGSFMIEAHCYRDDCTSHFSWANIASFIFLGFKNVKFGESFWYFYTVKIVVRLAIKIIMTS